MLHAAVIVFAILAAPAFAAVLWALDRRADRERERVRLEDAERMRLAA